MDAARLAAMQARVPGLVLSARGATRLRCADSELEILLVEPFDRGEGLSTLFAHCALPLVMFNSGRSLERPYLVQYFLSRPTADARRAEVLATAPKGRPSYIGSLLRDGERVRFQIEALASAHTAALAIEGEYVASSGELSFSHARSHTRIDPQRSRRRRPAPASRG